jgi:arylsulfatase A-like enzyme
VLSALGDFGALWLWVPTWPDRSSLAVRLFASLVPAGMLLGAVVAAMVSLGDAWVSRVSARLGTGLAERLERLRPWTGLLPLLVLLSPALVALVLFVFAGPRASKIAHRELLTVVAVVALHAGLLLAMGIVRAARQSPRLPAKWAVLLAAAVAYGFLSKVDQHAFPNLYLPLHAALSASAWASASASVLLSADVFSPSRRLVRWGTARAGALALAAAVAFTAHVATLGANPNVRVALFDPRAATSQSLMRALEPLLRMSIDSEAAKRSVRLAQEARARRKAVLAGGADLPTWEGAHVLLVTIDALRADHLGAYGYKRKLSPNIDALAAESVVFERAYAQAPHSSFSLSSLMASEYLHETVELGHGLPRATLPRVLGAAGYRDAAFFPLGIFHTEGQRLGEYQKDAFGFVRRDHRDLTAEPLTDAALEEMDRIVGEGEPPAFLWVHYFDVHEPYDATTFGTSPVDRYDSEIEIVDRALGRLLKGIEAKAKRDVIVVLSADHGEEFRDHGGVYHGSSLYEEQVRVPLLIRAPELPPRRIVEQVECVDVAPTLAAMATGKVPTTMRGDDLRAVMFGRTPNAGPAFGAVVHKRMAVRWPHKLIADLRFGLFELYDLEQDPLEHRNLAKREPALLESMTGEIYSWLDSLAVVPGRGNDSARNDPAVEAIALGRLGDRRAVPALLAVVRDERGDAVLRREAARMLGMLTDESARKSLAPLLESKDRLVRAEVAIALGRLFDPRARTTLRQLVYSEDPDLRSRAAVALARLRDRAAVPGLIEALWVASSTYDREEAVRWLGRLRDPRGLEPLLSLIPEFKLRHLTAAAIGLIGDPRAYQPLVEMLEWETRSDVRDQVVRGLGYLGNPEAIPTVISAALRDPGLRNAGETLVRLRAVERGALAGVDLHAGAPGVSGFGACHEFSPLHDWDYRQQTWCESLGAEVTVRLNVPKEWVGKDAFLVAVGRRLDSDLPVAVRVTLGGAAQRTLGAAAQQVASAPEWSVDKAWVESRWPVEVQSTKVTVRFRASDPKARLGVDHVLLLPENAAGVAGSTAATASSGAAAPEGGTLR